MHFFVKEIFAAGTARPQMPENMPNQMKAINSSKPAQHPSRFSPMYPIKKVAAACNQVRKRLSWTPTLPDSKASAVATIPSSGSTSTVESALSAASGTSTVPTEVEDTRSNNTVSQTSDRPQSAAVEHVSTAETAANQLDKGLGQHPPCIASPDCAKNDDSILEEEGQKHKSNKVLRAHERFKVKCKKIWRRIVKSNSDVVSVDERLFDKLANTHHYTEESDEGDGPRCDFALIEATTDATLEALVRSKCNVTEAKVFKRTKGAYNFAAIVSDSSNTDAQQYVVRVPGHGTLDHWTPEDVYMMDREVQLMKYIRHNTNAPIPEIIDYSTSHDNALGFPYILMSKVPGKNAYSIWFDKATDDDDAEFYHADVPSIATQIKRVNFLRSLARIMTEIQKLSFDKIGMPIIADPEGPIEIGPSYHWGMDGSDTATMRRPFKKTSVYGLSTIGSIAHKESLPRKEEKGANLFFQAVFFSPPFYTTRTNQETSDQETFTIHHSDLDLQNIFVDDDGNVTGIIDWDRSFAAPRCVGAAAAPFFLQKDWMPKYLNNLESSPYMAWKTHYYREIYAAALVEAGNPDAHYTTKSAIYLAAFKAVYGDGGDTEDFAGKLLAEIPHCRISIKDFLSGLGARYNHWKDAQDMLKEELSMILAPELPPTGLLAKVDAELALKSWLSSFGELVEEEEEEEEEKKKIRNEADPESATVSNKKTDEAE